MANWDGYAAIKAEANRLGWPESYHTDLTKHDRRILARKDAPQRFGWSIRQTGTDFYRPNSLAAIRWAQAMYQSGDPTNRYYWYDGTTLSYISLDELVDQLCQTLDSNFYQQQLQAATIRAADLWKRYFSSAEEREAYASAERERERARQNYNEVLKLTAVEQQEK